MFFHELTDFLSFGQSHLLGQIGDTIEHQPNELPESVGFSVQRFAFSGTIIDADLEPG